MIFSPYYMEKKRFVFVIKQIKTELSSKIRLLEVKNKATATCLPPSFSSIRLTIWEQMSFQDFQNGQKLVQILNIYPKCTCKYLVLPHIMGYTVHRILNVMVDNEDTRPAILAAGKNGGGMFLFLLFLHSNSLIFLCPSLSSHLLSLLSLFSLYLGDDTK